MTRNGISCAIALTALGLSACDRSLTEVVLVMASDLRPGADVDTVTTNSGPGAGAPQPFSGCFTQSSIGSFPASLALVSHGLTKSVSVTVQLSRTAAPTFTPVLVLSKTVIGIPFAEGESRMLVVNLAAKCACQGTTCPLPGVDPDCDDLEYPATVPFDSAQAPSGPESNGRCQVNSFGGGGPVPATRPLPPATTGAAGVTGTGGVMPALAGPEGGVLDGT